MKKAIHWPSATKCNYDCSPQDHIPFLFSLPFSSFFSPPLTFPYFPSLSLPSLSSTPLPFPSLPSMTLGSNSGTRSTCLSTLQQWTQTWGIVPSRAFGIDFGALAAALSPCGDESEQGAGAERGASNGACRCNKHTSFSLLPACPMLGLVLSEEMIV